jgi:hypothetical protein
MAVSLEIILHRLVGLEPRDGEALPAGEGCEKLRSSAAREVDSGPDGRWSERPQAARPELDEPRAVIRGGREPELDRDPAEAPVERRRQRRRVVDDQEVACVQKVRELREARVDERAVTPCRDHQGDVVAPVAAGFGRLVRLDAYLLGEGAHATTPASSRAR